VSFLGDAKSSLGDTKSSLGDAKSSLGDAKSSLGDAKSGGGATSADAMFPRRSFSRRSRFLRTAVSCDEKADDGLPSVASDITDPVSTAAAASLFRSSFTLPCAHGGEG
jgi:hypothetical protein